MQVELKEIVLRLDPHSFERAGPQASTRDEEAPGRVAGNLRCFEQP